MKNPRKWGKHLVNALRNADSQKLESLHWDVECYYRALVLIGADDDDIMMLWVEALLVYMKRNPKWHE